MTWKDVVVSTKGRWLLIVCITTLLLMMTVMPTYYREIIGPKPGILLNDPILNLFIPIDWSTEIFLILTIAIIQTLGMYGSLPEIILTGFTTFSFVNMARMIAMYTITLAPPPDMILLIDPISAFLVYPDKGFAKDLFFSGHVSTMMTLIYIDKNKKWKIIKIAATLLMGLFLAWQHVHYTIDLIVAPFATYLAFLLARKIVMSIWTHPMPE